MNNLILKRITDRISIDKDDSDSAYFESLLNAIEMQIKIYVALLLAGMEESKDRIKYNHIYHLVRCSSVGGWVEKLEDIVSGPSFSNLLDVTKDLSKTISEKTSSNWQYNVYKNLFNITEKLNITTDNVQNKSSLLQAFKIFVVIRNKTRGHGAKTINSKSMCCDELQKTFDDISLHLDKLNIEICYLKQNMSKKYRVTKVTCSSAKFDYLKSKTAVHYNEGLYVFYDKPRQIDVIFSNPDIEDFYFMNGSFTSKKNECLSYITGKVISRDSTEYSTPAQDIPHSITCGYDSFEFQNNFIGNIPPCPSGYIKRDLVEKELKHIIEDNRNPMITLLGRGGIGKTSLLLAVLHELSCNNKDIKYVTWFSARDIDLFDSGPKIVKSEALSKDDISQIYVNLASPNIKFDKMYTKDMFFSDILSGKNNNDVNYFIFDNFETVRNPVDVFNWINTNIRLPNKAIITTRFRDFKGDYPIEVSGMTKDESFELIISYAKKIGVIDKINEKVMAKIYNDTEGHPYIIKILLGGLRKEKNIGIEGFLRGRDDILSALFDRTYNMLSEPAKRLFITLGLWSSPVPELAVCALFSTKEDEFEKIDLIIEELLSFSFIEKIKAESEIDSFLTLPKTAHSYAKEKFKTSPHNYEAKKDIAILQQFGPTASSYSLLVEKIVKFINMFDSLKNDEAKINQRIEMLRYMANFDTSLCFQIAQLLSYKFQRYSIEFFYKFIEKSDDEIKAYEAWMRLHDLKKFELNEIEHDEILHCLVQAGLTAINFDLEKASDVTNIINYYISKNKDDIFSQKPKYNSMIMSFADELYRNIEAFDENLYSRCSWLYLNLGNKELAKKIITLGLLKNPDNEHCLKLQEKLL